MLKKAGVIAAAAAGLLMLGGPAFAGESHGGWHDTEGHSQVGLVNVQNVANDLDLNAIVGACDNKVGVLGGVVPVLSPSVTESCASGGIED